LDKQLTVPASSPNRITWAEQSAAPVGSVLRSRIKEINNLQPLTDLA